MLKIKVGRTRFEPELVAKNEASPNPVRKVNFEGLGVLDNVFDTDHFFWFGCRYDNGIFSNFLLKVFPLRSLGISGCVRNLWKEICKGALQIIEQAKVRTLRRRDRSQSWASCGRLKLKFGTPVLWLCRD
jgi:hypothetical protein